MDRQSRTEVRELQGGLLTIWYQEYLGLSTIRHKKCYLNLLKLVAKGILLQFIQIEDGKL